MREAAKIFEEKFNDYSTELMMNEDLYKSVKKYTNAAAKNGSLKKLDKESRRCVSKILEEFENGGMKLSK